MAQIPSMAEEQGFEPWVEFPPQRFSRPSRSAAPALLRTTALIPINYQFINRIKQSRYGTARPTAAIAKSMTSKAFFFKVAQLSVIVADQSAASPSRMTN
jgi:hypothetical protein